MKPITFYLYNNFDAEGRLVRPRLDADQQQMYNYFVQASNSARIMRATKNRAWVRRKVAERGWTQQIEDQAQYLLELGLDRLRAEERSCGT